MTTLRCSWFSLVVAVALAAAAGCTTDNPVATHPAADPVSPYTALAQLEIGPIDGVTTAWHATPSAFAVPGGTVLRFRRAAAPADAVEWTGAIETGRDPHFSFAECVMSTTGRHRVDVVVVPAVTGKRPDRPSRSSVTHACVIDVVDVPFSALQVRIDGLSRQPLHVDAGASNWETLRAFSAGSIAAVEQARPGVYRTAQGTVVEFAAAVEPAAFAPLVEWRLDGNAAMLGHSVSGRVDLAPGAHGVAAGPPDRAARATLETYRVAIEGPVGIPDGRLTFRAVTEPPGFEGGVTWLASTRYGSARPAIGRGEFFAVEFDATRGVDGARWVGVRADNASLAADAGMRAGGMCALMVLEYVGRPDTDPDNGSLYFPHVPCSAVPPPFAPVSPGGAQPAAITGAEVCYYDVTADNLNAACDSIFKSKGPVDPNDNKRHAGLAELAATAHWSETASSEGMSTIHIDSVTYSVKVYLPRWTNVNPDDQAAWDNLIMELEKHEQGHVDRYNQGMATVKQQVPCTSFQIASSSTDSTISVAANQQMANNPAYQAMEQSNAAYDAPHSPSNPTGTNHGTENGQNASWPTGGRLASAAAVEPRALERVLRGLERK